MYIITYTQNLNKKTNIKNMENLNEYQLEIEYLKEEINTLQGQLEDQDKVIDNLNEDLNSKDDLISSLYSQQDELNDDLTSKDEELSDKDDEIQELTSKVEDLESDIEDLQFELNKMDTSDKETLHDYFWDKLVIELKNKYSIHELENKLKEKELI